MSANESLQPVPSSSPRSPMARVRALLPGRRVKCYRMIGGGAVFHQVELPGGEIIGKGATPREAWQEAHAWAESNTRPAR